MEVGRGIGEEPLLRPRVYRTLRRLEDQPFQAEAVGQHARRDVSFLVRRYPRLHVHLRYRLVLSQLQGHPRHLLSRRRARRRLGHLARCRAPCLRTGRRQSRRRGHRGREYRGGGRLSSTRRRFRAGLLILRATCRRIWEQRGQGEKELKVRGFFVPS